MLNSSGFPSSDVKARIESAWSSVGLYDVLIVVFDVHRHLSRLLMVHPWTTISFFLSFFRQFHCLFLAKILQDIQNQREDCQR